jgi:dinuclear metal center YbgI/SA1388 family protein
MVIRDILSVIDSLAPFDLAEAWDHVGLQIGTKERDVEAVLVSLEADDAAFDAAARLGCGLVLAHHPLIFSPLERLTEDSEPGRLALRAAQDGLAVVVAHTSLDKAKGGLADVVAAMLGLEDTQPLQPASVDWLKLVGFVPPDDADLVRKALFAAGAGSIGDYEHCSWSAEGQGTFLPTEGAAPVVGEVGRDQATAETRIEVVFPRRLRRRVLAAYVGAHPYEEPAFDIVAVDNVLPRLGLGRVGVLPAALPLAAFAAEVAAVLRQPSLRYAGDGARLVRRVAVLPGSGAAAISLGVAGIADVLVTGDVKYHEVREALAAGLALVDAPHDVTEEEAVLRWSETLADALAAGGVRVETHRGAGAVWCSVGAGGEAFAAAARETADRPDAAALRRDRLAAAVAGGDGDLDRLPAAAPSSEAAPAAAQPAAAAPRPQNPHDSRHQLFTDGGARGNPGPAGIGARLLTAEGQLVEELGDAIGRATNNVAEYQALLAGLELALDHGVQRLDVFMDSELIVKQIGGQYRVKDQTLKLLYDQAVRLLHQFHEVELRHVPREQNSEADRLVNQAIDASLA